MKSVLIVTQQFLVGGLETHIRGEIQQLSAMGVQVHLATGASVDPSLLSPELASITSGIALEPSASAHEIQAAIIQIRQLIREHRIDSLHIHPFTSIIPAAAAAELETVPYALTLHGPDSLASFYGPTFDMLLKDVVLTHCSMVVAVSPEVQRLANAYAAENKVHYIPNTVSFAQPPRTVEGKNTLLQEHWLVVSRLDEAKVPGILDFCVKARDCHIPRISIAGDGPARQALEGQLQQQGLRDYVRFLGSCTNISDLMTQATGVAGMGRVLLEGIAACKPVVLVGYDGVKGLVNLSLFTRAADANFSGRGLPTIDQPTLGQQLLKQQLSDEVRELHALVSREFDEASAWAKFREYMAEAQAPKRSLLSGLHACLQATPASDVSPYLTSLDLLARLEIASFQKQYYDPRLTACIASQKRYLEQTQRDQATAECKIQIAQIYEAITECGEKIASLQQVMTERDGHITHLTNGMDERDINISSLNLGLSERETKIQQLTAIIVNLNQRISGLNQDIIDRNAQIAQLKQLTAIHCRELQNVHYSASWRITHPLRVSYSAVSKLGTPVFLRLPMRWRQAILNKMNPSAHQTPSVAAKSGTTVAVNINSDLSWEQFCSRVLSRRNQYKGIFIQEIVIDWNVPLYQRPQHMAVAMARLGYLVIYRTANWTADDVQGFREMEKDVWVTNCDEVDSIDHVIRSLYSTAYSNSVDNILKNGARGLIVYEYIDHIDPEISGDNENIKRLTALRNFAFSGGADYVVASAKKLYDEAVDAVGAEKTIMVQNGVDTRHYRNPRHKTQALPASLVDFKKKFTNIVGYFGALAPWLWYETIEDLVREKSDVGFVFIGPDYYGGVEKLPQTANVIYLGSVDYKILPAYAMTFDVCFIPFKPGDIAKSTSPLKLFEYFALEKPVVVTSDMLECTRYPEVLHGNSTAELSAAIDKALAIKDDAALKKRLSQLADENNWDMRAAGLIAGLQKIEVDK